MSKIPVLCVFQYQPVICFYFRNENFLDIDDQIPLISDLGDFDYEKMLGFTSELIALEVVNRVCITLVEVS